MRDPPVQNARGALRVLTGKESAAVVLAGTSSPVGRLARLLPWFACKAGQQRLPNALMRLDPIERDSQCQKWRDITCEDSILQFARKVGLEFRSGNLPAVVVHVPVEAVDNFQEIQPRKALEGLSEIKKIAP